MTVPQNVTESHDSNADARTLGEALVAAGRWEAALQTLGPALAAQPQDPALLALMLRSLRGAGRRQDAVNAAQQLLTAAPNDPYSFRLGTLALLDVGWVDEAIGLARRAVALDPSNAANHLALARAWAQSPRRGAIQAQLDAAREALMLAPNSADAQVQIGAALAAQGDAVAARAAYLEALRIQPDHSAALNNLAVLDLRAGDSAAAARQLAIALAAAPQGATARRNLDAAAVRVLHRMTWWAVLAPLPAIVSAAAGAPLAARLLTLIVLAAPVIVGWRWWRALSSGQRTYLRSLPRRVRRATLMWPACGLLLGAIGLTLAWCQLLEPASLLIGYSAAVFCLATIRTLLRLDRLGTQSFAADLRMRWQRSVRRVTGR